MSADDPLAPLPTRFWMDPRSELGELHQSCYISVMANAENTAPEQQKRVVGVPFKPGQSGNPAGRPKGARSKLGEAFVDALLADWQANGVQAIIDMRDEKPADYVKIVASILPKEISGPDGEPIEVKSLDTRNLSEATLRELAGASKDD